MENIFEQLYEMAGKEVADPGDQQMWAEARQRYFAGIKTFTEQLNNEQRQEFIGIVDDITLSKTCRERMMFRAGFRLCLRLFEQF